MHTYCPLIAFQVVDHFQKGELIGQGAFGKVYSALNLATVSRARIAGWVSHLCTDVSGNGCACLRVCMWVCVYGDKLCRA